MFEIRMTGEEVAKLGKQLYASSIRPKIETEENIGKFVMIDVETGDYEVDANGVHASRRIHGKHADAMVYGNRIGFKTAVTFGMSSYRFTPESLELLRTPLRMRELETESTNPENS